MFKKFVEEENRIIRPISFENLKGVELSADPLPQEDSCFQEVKNMSPIVATDIYQNFWQQQSSNLQKTAVEIVKQEVLYDKRRPEKQCQ